MHQTFSTQTSRTALGCPGYLALSCDSVALACLTLANLCALEADLLTMTTSQALKLLYSLGSSPPNFLRCLYCLVQNNAEEQDLSTI